MQEAAGDGRGWDISSLSQKGINYVNRLHAGWLKEKFPEFEQIDVEAPKAVARGARHPTTLMLLLPPRFLDDVTNNYNE